MNFSNSKSKLDYEIITYYSSKHTQNQVSTTSKFKKIITQTTTQLT